MPECGRALQKVVNCLSQYVFMGLLTEQLKTFLHSLQFLGGYNVRTVDASMSLLTEALGPPGLSGTARDRIPPYHCDSGSQAFLTTAARISSLQAATHPASLHILLHREGAGQAATSLLPISNMDHQLRVTQKWVQILLLLISSVISGTLRFSKSQYFIKWKCVLKSKFSKGKQETPTFQHC